MDKRTINKIVVHCSDSPDERDVRLKDINQWHQERGFSGILYNGVRIFCGYHYLILRDGSVEMGRPENYIGAHVAGHNKNSIGICWIGKHKISDEQLNALVSLIRIICLKHGLKASDVYGHSELFKGKTCPNIKMNHLRDKLIKELPSQGGLT